MIKTVQGNVRELVSPNGAKSAMDLVTFGLGHLAKISRNEDEEGEEVV